MRSKVGLINAVNKIICRRCAVRRRRIGYTGIEWTVYMRNCADAQDIARFQISVICEREELFAFRDQTLSASGRTNVRGAIPQGSDS